MISDIDRFYNTVLWVIDSVSINNCVSINMTITVKPQKNLIRKYNRLNFCGLTVIVLGSCMNFIINFFANLNFAFLMHSQIAKISSPQNFHAIYGISFLQQEAMMYFSMFRSSL